ncbi:MAG: EAL domain-containing protein [Bacillota bacterium]|nr:EAL domain-containing protein [Bacillota bacterium]
MYLDTCNSDETISCSELGNSIYKCSNILILVWNFNGDLININNYAKEITGFTDEDVLGGGWKSSLVEKDAEEDLNSIFLNRSKEKLKSPYEQNILTKGGKSISILWTNDVVFDDSGNGKFLISMGINMQNFVDINERSKLTASASNDGIWDWKFNTNEFFFSPRCSEILGFSNNEMPSEIDNWIKRIHPNDLEIVLQEYKNYIEKKTSIFACEFRAKAKNGKYKWVLNRAVGICGKNDKIVRLAGSLTDITERKKAEEKIHTLAYFDSLTHLPNKEFLLKNFKQSISRCNEKDYICSLFINLDNFKSINTAYGHSVGNKALKRIGEVLCKFKNNNNILTRFAADSFVFLVYNITDIEYIYEMAKAIMEEFDSYINIDNHELFVTASIGIAYSTKSGAQIRKLLKESSAAMYHAKAIGKNNYQVYSKDISSRAAAKIEMENFLRHAIELDEFVVYYQPQIDIKKKKIIGIEALVRWIHPTMGFISPNKFIPLAEETSLIVPIGEFVLNEACKQTKKWHDMGYDDLHVCVNLSAKQFHQSNLLSTIKSALDKSGLLPDLLHIEITESATIDDFDVSISTLNELREMGVKVSLDDFGTGYSSLSYLRKLPIDILKIDKSFVDEIAQTSNENIITSKITGTLIALAHSLDLLVVAEGVEYVEQLDILKNQSCDIIQGYYFSKPLSANDLERLLEEYKNTKS